MTPEKLEEAVARKLEAAAEKKRVSDCLISLWVKLLNVESYHTSLAKVLPRAVDEFGLDKVTEAMEIVAARRCTWAHEHNSHERDLRYFCGITRYWRPANDNQG